MKKTKNTKWEENDANNDKNYKMKGVGKMNKTLTFKNNRELPVSDELNFWLYGKQFENNEECRKDFLYAFAGTYNCFDLSDEELESDIFLAVDRTSPEQIVEEVAKYEFKKYHWENGLAYVDPDDPTNETVKK